MVTDKNKEQFKKWMNPTDMPTDFKYGQMLGSNFAEITLRNANRGLLGLL